MERINLKGYQSARAYVADFCQYSKRRNPRFTLGLLSRKLGLPQTATLSRILNGERKIGPELFAKLTRLFNFNEYEKKIFDILVRLDLEKEPLIIEALRNKLAFLDEENASHTSPAFQFQARSLNLWGEIRPLFLNHELKKFGFETIASYGISQTPFCLNFAQVNAGNEQFMQFSMAGYVKRASLPLADSEIFFHYLFSNHASINQFYNNLGSPYELSTLTGNFEDLPTQVSVLCEASQGSIQISFQQTEAEIQPFLQPNDVFGYNTQLKDQFAFPMRFRSTALMRPFDPNLDKCSWSSHSELGQLLDAIQFKPKVWTYHKDFTCEIYMPVKRHR